MRKRTKEEGRKEFTQLIHSWNSITGRVKPKTTYTAYKIQQIRRTFHPYETRNARDEFRW